MKTIDAIKRTQLPDLDSRERIQVLVNSFYSKARKDKLLGPVFEEMIDDWESHLPTMYNFWEKVLLGTGDYQGNPFQKHIKLHIVKKHFNVWIELFFQTVDDNFFGVFAKKSKRLATNISETFQHRLGIDSFSSGLIVPKYVTSKASLNKQEG